MYNFVPDALLAELMEDAKAIGNKENAPFTAERFILALLVRINHGMTPERSQELWRLNRLLISFPLNRIVARRELKSYVCDEKGSVMLDQLYMEKRLQEAVLRSEGKPMTAETLLHCIKENPSPAIEAVIKQSGGRVTPVKTEAEEPDLSDMFDALVDEEEDQTPEMAKEQVAKLVSEVKRIHRELDAAVYGQAHAIQVFTNGYFQANMRSWTEETAFRRPKATFLFAGPPGVGKTFLAETVAASLKLPFMRFDMSEYADKESPLEFCGSDKVYKNGKVGNVTDFVAKNPKCVLLFDEIEKAHLNVIYLFLQMLDAGRLRDNYTDKEVSFADAVIILTTNAGRQLYEESESLDLSHISRKVIIQALQDDKKPGTDTSFFPSAICSRFASGNVVMFNHISAHDLRQIAKKEIENRIRNFRESTGITVETDESVYTALLFSEGASVDARTIRSRAAAFFNDELYELLRLVDSEKVQTDVNTLEKIRISVDLSHAKPEITSLFQRGENPKVLIFAHPQTVAHCEKLLPGIPVLGAQDVNSAIKLMQSNELSFVLMDVRFGAGEAEQRSLNAEDLETPARAFYQYLRQQKIALPVYLLENRDETMTEEERISFTRQGVRGTVSLAGAEEEFFRAVDGIATGLHQQASVVSLARGNRLVSFETAQTVSPNGKEAEIRLFDLVMSVAVDSRDSKQILSNLSRPDVTFGDVIGAKDAKEELAYFTEYLKNPRKYIGTGVKAPRGVILYGPPGTGKTMLAKAMAKESGVTYIATEGNQFLKSVIGEGPEHVHTLFRTARKYAPSILFIDEIDAIARERGSASSTAGREDVLTAFLTEMDGFVNDPSKPVFVLAATNYDVTPGGERSLDPALMRRFDRRVYIDLPGKEDRVQFLEMKVRKNAAFTVSPQQISTLAVRSTGMSLAELDSALELALRSAIREGSGKVTDSILEEAFETFNNGETKKWDESLLERTARHEAGHALLYWHGGEIPAYLTVVARSGHGGYMQHADQEGKRIHTKADLLRRIRTSLGGRAAETVYYGQEEGLTTGASSDLAKATATAQRLVCSYGMDESMGMAVVDSSVPGAITPEIRQRVNEILREQMEQALETVEQNRDKIDALVAQLMVKNHLTGPQIQEILGPPTR